MQTIHHALVLNLHQPAGNLDHLLAHNTWEAKEILWAYDRIPRSLWEHQGLARVHLAMSGTLLETLSDPEFQKRVYGTVDCGALLWHLQNESLIRILGTGYYHPVLPLIPEADREEHLRRWQGIASHLFWREHFSGFWPPEMGFSMELIPLLEALGYRYVLVDSDHVAPVGQMAWHDLRYRPHVARYAGSEITVIVRDRELSDAQESGMEFAWFDRELRERTKWCDTPPLVTTATDGENGGWFRNTTEGANYWSAFYGAFMAAARDDATPVRPVFIDDYLDHYGVSGEVTITEGAWNTGWHHGSGFLQWTGSQAQKQALDRVSAVSRAFHAVAKRARDDAERAGGLLREAHWRLLRAETSCNFYWGEDWLPRATADLDAAEACVRELEAALHRPTD